MGRDRKFLVATAKGGLLTDGACHSAHCSRVHNHAQDGHNKGPVVTKIVCRDRAHARQTHWAFDSSCDRIERGGREVTDQPGFFCRDRVDSRKK